MTCAVAASCAHTGANAASTSASGADPTGAWRSPARAIAPASDRGAATSTSCSSRTHARASGISGPRWPPPRVVAKRIRTGW